MVPPYSPNAAAPALGWGAGTTSTNSGGGGMEEVTADGPQLSSQIMEAMAVLERLRDLKRVQSTGLEAVSAAVGPSHGTAATNLTPFSVPSHIISGASPGQQQQPLPVVPVSPSGVAISLTPR